MSPYVATDFGGFLPKLVAIFLPIVVRIYLSTNFGSYLSAKVGSLLTFDFCVLLILVPNLVAI